MKGRFIIGIDSHHFLVFYLITLELTMYFIPHMPHPLPALPDQEHQHQSPCNTNKIWLHHCTTKTKEGNAHFTWTNDPHSTKFNAVNGLIPLFALSVLAQNYHNGGINGVLGCPHYARSCEFWFSSVTIALDHINAHIFVHPFEHQILRQTLPS